jgi:Tripartite tricarboxylate transporter TctB family
MQLRNPKDFWAGVMFALIGVVFIAVIYKYEYPLGTARSMGPGRFPMMVAVALTLLGSIIVLKSFFSDGAKVGKFAWRPLLWILGGVVLFGLTVKTIGLALAIIMLVLIAAYGGHEFKLREQMVVALVLAVGCALVFVKGLKLAFPIWPIFFN